MKSEVRVNTANANGDTILISQNKAVQPTAAYLCVSETFHHGTEHIQGNNLQRKFC